MTPAELLREAANRIEHMAAAATAGPWFADENENCWRLHGRFEHAGWPGGVGPSKQILKAPKRNTPYAEYWPEQGDADWITTMHPGVAAPLAAWLRAEADQQDGLCGDTCPGVTCVASRSLARSILREEP